MSIDKYIFLALQAQWISWPENLRFPRLVLSPKLQKWV